MCGGTKKTRSIKKQKIAHVAKVSVGPDEGCGHVSKVTVGSDAGFGHVSKVPVGSDASLYALRSTFIKTLTYIDLC